MICGAHGVGGLLLDGVIRDVRAVAESGDVALTWAHDGVTADSHRYAIGLDGDLVAFAPPGSREWSLGLVEEGVHRVSVLPVRLDQRRAPELHGEPYGNRAWIAWDASTDADVRAYLVYGDGGTGTVNYGAALEVIEDIVVEEAVEALATSGGGTGRVSIWGAWGGEATNRLVSIKIAAGGFETDAVGGSYELVSEFSRGQVFEAGNGVWVRFHDDRGDYATGAIYSVRVGPRASWQSGELVSGSYKFAVAARDAAGNVGTAGDVVTVRVLGRSRPVTGLSASWDGTEITLAWTPPADGADLGDLWILSNHSPVFGRLMETLVEDGPLHEFTAVDWDEDPPTGYEFEPGVEGVWIFAVRTRHASTEGHDDSVELVTVDVTAIPSALELREPEGLTATPAAGGTMVLAWRYPWDEGGDVTAFRIYANEDDEAPSFATPLATVAASSGSVASTEEYSHTTGVLAGPRYFTVRAVAGSVETTNAEMVLGTPDATAPTVSGAPTGVPN